MQVFVIRLVVVKYFPALDPPDHYMVQSPQCIQSRLPCHDQTLFFSLYYVNVINNVPHSFPFITADKKCCDMTAQVSQVKYLGAL